jgi:alpha-beta hydrolase superfamily lysophospholipase
LSEATELLTMTDDFKLFVRHWLPSEKTGKTVICIHGLGACCECFKNLALGLVSRGIDVWGLDLRGFGNSKENDIPRGDTKNFKRHIDDIAEASSIIQRTSNCKNLFLLGHSLGALYVLWYGANFPQAVDGLVLLAPAVVNKRTMSPKERAKFALALASSPGKMLDTSKVSSMGNSFEMSRNLPVTSSFSVRYLMGLRRFVMQDNISINASKNEKPSLIIQGDADEDALPIGAKQLFANIAAEDKKLEIMPGAKHTLYGTMISARGNFDDNQKGQESIISLICSWLGEH